MGRGTKKKIPINKLKRLAKGQALRLISGADTLRWIFREIFGF